LWRLQDSRIFLLTPNRLGMMQRVPWDCSGHPKPLVSASGNHPPPQMSSNHRPSSYEPPPPCLRRAEACWGLALRGYMKTCSGWSHGSGCNNGVQSIQNGPPRLPMCPLWMSSIAAQLGEEPVQKRAESAFWLIFRSERYACSTYRQYFAQLTQGYVKLFLGWVHVLIPTVLGRSGCTFSENTSLRANSMRFVNKHREGGSYGAQREKSKSAY
jgi:hypothetical protein